MFFAMHAPSSFDQITFFVVGKNVTHVKPGDRVAIEVGSSCRKCDECKRGHYHLCPSMIFAATPPYDGTLARYYCTLGDLAYPLPDSMSLEDGALVRLHGRAG
jgi:D-xylulose reductase